MKRRVLSEDEVQLWERVTHGDRKLEHERFIEKPMAHFRIEVSQPRMAIPVWHEDVSQAPLMLGGYAGIDRNTAARFRKGELTLDGTVDLHGMSREKAHMRVSEFIHAHYGWGSRCLLAITGKGMKKAGEADVQPGILREMLPQWLAEPGLRGFVLACDVAKPKHGGGGAYYILLRRKR